MTRHFPKHLVATLALISAGIVQGQTAQAPQYAGQQQRAIKALSDSDISGLLAGQGAGLAKAAELNGYPGPAHVLELSTDLHLNEAQAAATRHLMAQHKLEASRLGAALVDAERQLDSLFAQRQATPAEVDKATAPHRPIAGATSRGAPQDPPRADGLAERAPGAALRELARL